MRHSFSVHSIGGTSLRYQSALGLAADLQRCLTELDVHGSALDFELARDDVSRTLRLPRELQGREPALQELKAAFESVITSGSGLSLVAGPSGIGRSALVAEFCRRAAAHGAYVASGKFEQLKRDVPYTGIASAFRELGARFLAETSERLEQRKQTLRAALGDACALILGILPELRALFDCAALPLETSPASPLLAKQVASAFARFVGALARSEEPLVLVLDDLQWADEASLSLLESVLKSDDVNSLYVVGTFRDSDIGTAHPLRLFQKSLSDRGVACKTMQLGALQVHDVTAFLAQTLNQDPENVSALGEVVSKKTGGNPLFLRTFVDTLHGEGLLRLDTVRRAWIWDLDAIRARPVTENVVDLLLSKIELLEPGCKQLLQIAACLGTQFHVRDLSLASGQNEDAVRTGLVPMVETGLMLRSDTAVSPYRFAHDRIQQVAYEQISEAERVLHHQRIGRALFAATPAQKINEQLFELLRHLNFGLDRLDRASTFEGLAGWNLMAARRAAAMGAYAIALRYCETALRLLPAAPWQTEYQLTQQVHVEGAFSACFAGDLKRATELAQALREQGRTALDRAPAFEAQARVLWAKNQLPRTVDVCVEGLAELGVKVPREPGPELLRDALQSTATRLRGRNLSEIAALPAMTDPEQLAAMRLFESCEMAVMQSSQPLFALVALRFVNAALDSGISPASVGSFVALAIVLCNPEANTREFGNMIADVAQEVARAVGGGPSLVTGLSKLNCGVRHWKRHIRDTLPELLSVTRTAKAAGDVESSAPALCFYCLHSLYAGVELTGLLRECEEYAFAMRRVDLGPSQVFLGRVRQCMLNLTGDAEKPWVLVGEACNENVSLVQLEKASAWMQFTAFMVEKIALANIFGQSATTLEYLTRVEPHERHLASLYRTAVYHFHGALARLSACRSTTGAERECLKQAAAVSLNKLRSWAADAPMNFLHCVHLVEAELASVEGDTAAALDNYEAAIQLAREHRFVNDEALAHELAGRFHLARGRRTAGNAHLVAARSAWARWGASAKVRFLENEFPELKDYAAYVFGGTHGSSGVSGSTKESSSPRGTSSKELDAESVVKASQALSSEIRLRRLIVTLMRIAVENAGAERGALILRKDADLTVEAVHTIDASADNNQAPGASSTPLDASEAVPTSIVRYVARVVEPLVLADAMNDARFAADAYVRKARPRSVLAMPIVRQGTLCGVLYLENNRNLGAFTPQRVQTLSLLAAQAAISIDNAALYEQLSLTTESLRQSSDSLRQSNTSLEQALSALDNHLHRLNLVNEFSLRAGGLQGAEDVSALATKTLHTLVSASASVAFDVQERALVPLHLCFADSNAICPITREPSALPKYVAGRFDAVLIRPGAPDAHCPEVALAAAVLARKLVATKTPQAATTLSLVLPMFRKNGKLIGLLVAAYGDGESHELGAKTSGAADLPLVRLLQLHIETAIENVLVQADLRRQIAMRSEGLAEALARLSGTEETVQRPLSRGEVLNERYVITGELGKGAMGVVYETRRRSDNQKLALKLLARPDTNQMARFAREAQIISRLNHPNVVSIVDVDVASAGFFFLVMEYVNGRSLDQYRSCFGDLPWALELLRQTAEGLTAIHGSGIVHRDLKPANLLVAEEGGAQQIKIADFGISKIDYSQLESGDGGRRRMQSVAFATTSEALARHIREGNPHTVAVSRGKTATSAGLTEVGAVMGTLKYMAPEAMGDPEIGIASDLFSFALFAYEMISAEYPFPESAALIAARNEPLILPEIPGLPHSIHQTLLNLLQRCVSVSPDQRPSAREVADTLATLVGRSKE